MLARNEHSKLKSIRKTYRMAAHLSTRSHSVTSLGDSLAADVSARRTMHE